jgi:hypothetical protein
MKAACCPTGEECRSGMGRSMSALESHAVLLKRLEGLAKPQGDYGKYEQY